MKFVFKVCLYLYYFFILLIIECTGGIFDYSNPGAYAGCMIITTSLRIGSIPVGTKSVIK